MFLSKPIDFIATHIELLSSSLNIGEKKVTNIQSLNLAMLLSVILLNNRVCWSDVEITTLGKLTKKATWWFYAKSSLPWDHLLKESISTIMKTYNLKEGALAIDDTDNPRCKKTPLIAYTHKYFDKKTSGYKNGQQLVFIVLVTEKVTFPVGYVFYEADPAITKWKRQEKKLIAQGVDKKERPKRPKASEGHRSMTQLGATLVKDFKDSFPEFKIKTILADALYGSNSFFEDMQQIKIPQLISVLKKDQKLTHDKKNYEVDKFFEQVYKPVAGKVTLRGGREKSIMYRAARVHVNAHGGKRIVIAMKYEEQSDYRYLVASNVSWRAKDVMNAYTLRWLVEVFFEDTKANGGWFNMAKQQGEDGSKKSLILSLLLDHAILCHPEQQARIKNKLPAFTVGSLRALESMQSTMNFAKEIISETNAEEGISSALDKLHMVFNLRESSKHMVGKNLGHLDERHLLKGDDMS